MAYTSTLIVNGKSVVVYVDEGLRTPGTGDRLTMTDPKTGKKYNLIAGADAWLGSDEMEPPAGAIKLEFVNEP